jgi:hypothetical protein
VDVNREFELAGVTYRTVISCKDWQASVKKEQVLSLKAILDDLEGQPSGVLVTRTGFQAGAEDFARSQGIVLYELREPRDSDWEGYIREIETTMILLIPRMRDFTLEEDRAWLLGEKERLGLPDGWGMTVHIPSTPADEVVFVDDKGEPLMTAKDAIQGMLHGCPEEFEERSARFDFPEPAYLETGDKQFPRVRIKSVSAKIAQGRRVERFRTDLSDIPVWILRDVVKGTVTHMFDNDLRVLGQ